VAEEGRGENEVVQPVNPAANVAANAATNPPANAAANVAGNVANNTANAAGAQQQNVATNTGQNVSAQPAAAQANYPQSSQRRRIQDKVEIARRAKYDRDNGVPDPLDANHPIKATELR
jgi:hypothetical protein